MRAKSFRQKNCFDNLNILYYSHPIILSQIIASAVSGIFSVVSLVRFLALYILSHCIFLLHHSRFMAWNAQELQSKCQSQNKEAMLSTALGFPIGNRVTDHCSILVPEAVGFSQELLPP